MLLCNKVLYCLNVVIVTLWIYKSRVWGCLENPLIRQISIIAMRKCAILHPGISADQLFLGGKDDFVASPIFRVETCHMETFKRCGKLGKLLIPCLHLWYLLNGVNRAEKQYAPDSYQYSREE